MLRTAVLTALATFMFLSGNSTAEAHLVVSPKNDSLKSIEKSQTLNLAHARYVCNNGRRAHKTWSCNAVKWISKELRETRRARNPYASEMAAAWAWYNTGSTQCVVNHEGGWGSVNSAGYYGRFQMDVGFQTAYGAEFYYRFGTANNWPQWAQVVTAYRGWKKRWYYPWPTYFKYCT